MTKWTDREISIYKISEAAKVIGMIRDNSGSITDLFYTIRDLPEDQFPPEHIWNIMRNTLLTLNITIRKPTERPESMDDLSGMEILKRSEFRSCHDALCRKPHCTECGKCGAKKHDEHLCKCPVCGLEYISSAQGVEHNLDGECKDSSGEKE